jgi:predicted Zn-dependent protease
VLNSEGTQLRKADTGIVITISAEGQADDGMRFSDGRYYVGATVSDLPPLDTMCADIDKMVADLTAAMNAPILESYTGPVLFDGRAAPQMFRVMLANGVVGRPEPLGTQRRGRGGSEGLDRQLGLLVLPKSFQVFDDPTAKTMPGTGELLAGHYAYDDEGVPAQRVDIVVNGLLKDLCMSRSPTRKLAGSNGHGRQMGSGRPQATIGNLFIEDKKGLADSELREKLIEAAKEAGLDYGIRVAAIRSTDSSASRGDLIALLGRIRRAAAGGRGMGGLGDPVLAYKVFVKDGHEEPVRGCEFGEVEVKTLK